MSLFSEIEKTVEKGFRHWTERVFGPAESDQLLLVHRAILEDVEGKVQVLARGRRVFPFPKLVVTLSSPDVSQRTVYQSAFAADNRLQKDILSVLQGAECEAPRGFTVEIRTAEEGDRPYAIEYLAEVATPAAAPSAMSESGPAQASAPARLVVVRGKATNSEYELKKARVNIGRLAELTDADHRVVRRNDIVFEEGADDANATVSRAHAHIRRDGGEYRLSDEGSEFGSRIFRDGRSIEVPAGARGEKLKPGDEIYLGRACVRFEE